MVQPLYKLFVRFTVQVHKILSKEINTQYEENSPNHTTNEQTDDLVRHAESNLVTPLLDSKLTQYDSGSSTRRNCLNLGTQTMTESCASPVESVDAVPVAAEWHDCDVCLFVGPLNFDPDDDGVAAAAASECCCLQQANTAACYCCCLHCSH